MSEGKIQGALDYARWMDEYGPRSERTSGEVDKLVSLCLTGVPNAGSTTLVSIGAVENTGDYYKPRRPYLFWTDLAERMAGWATGYRIWMAGPKERSFGYFEDAFPERSRSP